MTWPSRPRSSMEHSGEDQLWSSSRTPRFQYTRGCGSSCLPGPTMSSPTPLRLGFSFSYSSIVFLQGCRVLHVTNKCKEDSLLYQLVQVPYKYNSYEANFFMGGGNAANRQFCDKKARSFQAKDDLTG